MTVPSRVPWWPVPPSYLGYAGPDDHTQRACGCRIDPVVFGHHFTCPTLAAAS